MAAATYLALGWGAGLALSLITTACTADGRKALRMVAQDTPGTWALAAAFFAAAWPAIMIGQIIHSLRHDSASDRGDLP